MTRLTAQQAKAISKKLSTKSKAIVAQAGSIGEAKLRVLLRNEKIDYVPEFRFNPNSKHRADFYLPDYNCLLEVEGGTTGKSRHTTHIGYSNDLIKYNMAQILGYSRLAFTTEQVGNGIALKTILTYIDMHKQRIAKQLTEGK